MIGFASSSPQFLQARQGGAVVQAFGGDEPGPDHGADAALAAPAVDVNHSAGVELGPNVPEYPVVSRILDHVS